MRTWRGKEADVTVKRTAFSERQGEEIPGALLSHLLSIVDISFRMSNLPITVRNRERTALQRAYIIISKYFDVVNEKTGKITGHKKRERETSAFGTKNFPLSCFVKK